MALLLVEWRSLHFDDSNQTEIDQAIKDQIGTNPEEPLPSNPDITQALANHATEAARVAAVLNNNLQSNYLTGFQNWS